MTQNRLPLPIQRANAVLETLPKKEAEKLGKAFRAFAMKQGDAVTEEYLRAHIPHLGQKAKQEKPVKTYESILRDLYKGASFSWRDLADLENRIGKPGFNCDYAFYLALSINDVEAYKLLSQHLHVGHAATSAIIMHRTDIARFHWEKEKNNRNGSADMANAAIKFGHAELIETIYREQPGLIEEAFYGTLKLFGRTAEFPPPPETLHQLHALGFKPNLETLAESWRGRGLSYKMLASLRAMRDIFGLNAEDILAQRETWTQILPAASLAYIAHHGLCRVPEELKDDDYQTEKHRIEHWTKIARRDPLNLLHIDLNPALFRPQAYAAAKRMMREDDDLYAFRASAFFGTERRMLEYFARWGQKGRQPFHDVIQHIDIGDGNFDMTAWADACIQHGPAMAKLTRFADRLPQPLKNTDGTWSLKKTQEATALFLYKKADLNPELAKLCHSLSVTEESFETARKLLEKAPLKKNIPNIY